MKPLGSQVIAEFINCSEDVLDNQNALEEILKQGIRRCGLTLISTDVHKFDPVGVTAVALIGESHVVIHTYPEARHASIDIFTCSAGSHARNDLVRFLESELKPSTIRLLDVDRGNPLEVRQADWITSFSSNGYETRYHVKNLLFSARSRYQQIDIIENDNFGRMLFLDKDLQIAEADAALYNASLVAPIVSHREAPARVAILGGGDGGVLSEVLKYDPASVVLVDIDETVIDASRRFLKSICGDAFDDPSVEVVIQDANEYLEENHNFDAIVYDLTMYPEALTSSDRRAFLNTTFSNIGRSLTNNGIVTMQCCSEFDRETRTLLTQILGEYFANIDFAKVFIPSFCENWMFASARSRKVATLHRSVRSMMPHQAAR